MDRTELDNIPVGKLVERFQAAKLEGAACFDGYLRAYMLDRNTFDAKTKKIFKSLLDEAMASYCRNWFNTEWKGGKA